jgi:hypothetical protein
MSIQEKAESLRNVRGSQSHCDYCGHPRVTLGYVAAYDATVCVDCYEDHHGPCA